MGFAYFSGAIKAGLGGFFMAIYRLICMKKSAIAMSVQTQQKIVNELIILEWIILALLTATAIVGSKLKGEFLGIKNFLSSTQKFKNINDFVYLGPPVCRATKMEKLSETPLGRHLIGSALVCSQIFVVVELLIYIILFKARSLL